jgi:hypothetical protein
VIDWVIDGDRVHPIAQSITRLPDYPITQCTP